MKNRAIAIVFLASAVVATLALVSKRSERGALDQVVRLSDPVEASPTVDKSNWNWKAGQPETMVVQPSDTQACEEGWCEIACCNGGWSGSFCNSHGACNCLSPVGCE